LIRLPGKLARIAGVERAREKDIPGIAMEIGGFVLMFLFFPWGLLLGGVLVWLGWKRCNRWVCANCKAKVSSRWLPSCPSCKTKFGAE
jgi:hypothetical protein